MTIARAGLVVGMVAAVVLIGSARWSARAQVGKPAIGKPAARPTAEREAVAVVPSAASIQDRMLRPYSWHFREETTLEAVADHLRKGLGGPVVLDRAALTRRKLTAESTVRLELEGVRLKTGLKLLLDQVGLTFQVVPEDNLLILTDAEGAEDASSRILAELRSLHRDVHDLQDALDDLREDLGYKAESGPTLRKPTIIEEIPEGEGDSEAMPEEKPARSRPGL